TRRQRNPVIYCIHQFVNGVNPFFFTSQSTGCRTFNDRSVIPVEVTFVQFFTDFHLHQIQQFRIIHQIHLIQVHNHCRYSYLCSQQNVLFCLRHRTIGSSHNQDSTIHLSSTSNHIFHVVSVTGTIHVCIVTSSCLIFHVSGIDSNTSFFFFRSSVNIIIFSCLS